ncbi:PREDICTED: uncharacterized protein LOC106886685 [Calidris pugnax]|uniref:uncharacterized protein LOC106886685 n=1 Tax=Calidris pugnax TaxID=198806 RepID=UPI00071D1364|nr:PREDICTED: uncharacterized protein LOC106886685 [Calidris pugnax]
MGPVWGLMWGWCGHSGGAQVAQERGAAEGPSLWSAAPGHHVGRAAVAATELGQATSNGLALEMGSTSACQQRSGEEEHLDPQTSRNSTSPGRWKEKAMLLRLPRLRGGMPGCPPGELAASLNPQDLEKFLSTHPGSGSGPSAPLGSAEHPILASGCREQGAGRTQMLGGFTPSQGRRTSCSYQS